MDGTRRILGFAILATAIGCTSAPLGPDPMVNEQAGKLMQVGVAELFQTADGVQVAYPRPFGAVPKLTLGEGKGSIPASEVEVLDQQPDHFTVRPKKDGFSILSWRAEGAPGQATALPKKGSR